MKYMAHDSCFNHEICALLGGVLPCFLLCFQAPGTVVDLTVYTLVADLTHRVLTGVEWGFNCLRSLF